MSDMKQDLNNDAIDAYRMTLEIARNTWDLASKKAVRTMNADDLLEAKAALYWVGVARENYDNARNEMKEAA